MSKHNIQDKTMQANLNSFIFYYQWLKLLCISMFKYENLPNRL